MKFPFSQSIDLLPNIIRGCNYQDKNKILTILSFWHKTLDTFKAFERLTLYIACMVKRLRIFHFIISRVVKYPRRHVVYFINTYTYSDVRIAIWIVAIRQCLKKIVKRSELL